MDPDKVEMLAIIKAYLVIAPAFRSKPIGAPNSTERLWNDTKIAWEDRARAILAKAEG